MNINGESNILSYKTFNLSNSLVEPGTLLLWLDTVGNLQPFGQIEFFGLLTILVYVLVISVDESLLAIAAVQL